MGFTIQITRNLNIFDNNIQKDFNITDIKKIKDGNLDIFLLAYCSCIEDENKILNKEYNKSDYNNYWLYSFKMNGIDYVEYVSKSEQSNGNHEHIYVSYRKRNEYEKEKETIYINQGGECPKCKKSYYLEKNNNYKCLECLYEGTEDDFFYNFDNVDIDENIDLDFLKINKK